MEQIRIGLIGAGGNTTSRHIPGFKKIEGLQLLTVANRSIASSETVAKEFGILEIATDWQNIIEDERVDAVCIGTWPDMHCPITLSLIHI